MNLQHWTGLFCQKIDFIWAYFDLISSALQSFHWFCEAEFHKKLLKLLNLVRILQSNLSWFFYIEESFSGRFWFYLTLFWSNLAGASTSFFNFMIYLRFLLIRENDWGHEGLFATPPANPRVFIDADWTGFLFSYILFILIVLFWFISLILLIFVEILKPAVWSFLSNWGGVLHFTPYIWLFALFGLG